jgi:DNA-binding IclR family transcriptional regulator
MELPPRAGTQSIERTVRILTALASRVPSGWRLPDLASHCELDRATVRRILGCLVRERLAEHRMDDQRYLPGPMLFELGLALPRHGEFQRAAIACLERIAAGRDVGRFLCFRSGLELVCAGRVSGVAHGYTLHEGARRSLVSSVAGIAMIVALPPGEAERVFRDALAIHERGGGARSAGIRSMLRKSLQAGMGINEGFLTPGWNSYAVAVRNARGEPFASVMVTAGAEHWTPERVASICKTLGAAALQLQEAGKTDLAQA